MMRGVLGTALAVFGLILLLDNPSHAYSTTLNSKPDQVYTAAIQVVRSMTANAPQQADPSQHRIITTWTPVSYRWLRESAIDTLSLRWLQGRIEISPTGNKTKITIWIQEQERPRDRLSGFLTGIGITPIPPNAPLDHWSQLFIERLAWTLGEPEPAVGDYK